MKRPRPPTRFTLKAPNPLGTDIHKACLDLLAWALVRGCYWHTPNGFFTSGGAAEWARMLALGAFPGAPDIFVAQDGRLYGLEVKQPGEPQLDSQVTAQEKLTRAGVPYAVIESPEEAYDTLAGWGVALRRMSWSAAPLPAASILVRPLTAEWHSAIGDAAKAWTALLHAAPPKHIVWQELSGAENRLRQLAMSAAL